MEWTTASLCARIVEDARVPKGGRYRTVASLLPLLDRHLRTAVVPRLLETAENHLAATVDTALVAEKDTYRIPWRSLRLLDVALLDDQDRPVADFHRTTERQARELAGTTPGRPRFWYLHASSVVLAPPPSGVDGYTLRLSIARRPSQLKDSTTTWTVLAVGASYVDVAGASAPTVQTYDFIKGTPGFESVKDDATPSAVAVTAGGWRLTYSGATWLTKLEVGDYVAPMGYSPVPQVPLDYLPVLEQAVIEQLKRDNGDMVGASSARDAKAALEGSAKSILEPRATEDTTVIPGWDP